MSIDCEYIRNRITELRIEKGVSEYRMSFDLGHSRSYFYNISLGVFATIKLVFANLRIF